MLNDGTFIANLADGAGTNLYQHFDASGNPMGPTSPCPAGSASPLVDSRRAFGAIEGVYVPNCLGFLFFTVALLLILWIIGLGAIVGLGFGGRLTAQQGVFWLGALIGALVSDCLFSHWIPYLAGYRPNPGVRSTALYVVEAAVLLAVVLEGLVRLPRRKRSSERLRRRTVSSWRCGDFSSP